MFEDAGKQIKFVALVTFIVECAASVISGIALMASDDDLILLGLLIFVVGSLLAYVSGLIIHGFGEIVDTAIANRKNVPAVPSRAYPAYQPAPAPVPQPMAQPNPAFAPQPLKHKVTAEATPSDEEMALYLGKKMCSGCGEILPADAVVCPECGSKYLGKITKTNVTTVLANLNEK